MAFSREDLAAYEKSAPAASAPAPTPPASAPSAPAQPEASSAPAPDSDPAVPVGDETSADTADSAPAAAAPDSEATNDGDGDAAPAAPAPGGRARDRIEGLIVERDALRSYGEHLQQRLKDLEAKAGVAPAPAAAPAPTAPPADDPAPTLESVGFDPVQFSQQQNEWLQRQVDKRVEAALTGAQQKQTVEAARAKFSTSVDTLVGDDVALRAALANPNLPKLDESAARAVVFSDAGAKITVHLATHPDLAARISRMPREQQLVQIGKLEAQLSTPAPAPAAAKPTPPKQKSSTNAPPPPTPVPSGPGPSKAPSDMSMDEWVANERGKKIAARMERQKMRAAMR